MEEQSNYPRYGGNDGNTPNSRDIILDFNVDRIWNFLKTNLNEFLPATLLLLVISVILTIGATVGISFLVYGTLIPTQHSVGQTLISQAILLVPFSLLYVLYIGFPYLALRALRGDEYSVSTIFFGFKKVASVFVLSSVPHLINALGAIVGVGQQNFQTDPLKAFGSSFVLILIVSIVQSYIYWLGLYILDQDLGPSQALKAFCADFKGKYLSSLAYVLLFGLLSGVGAICCGVGILITYPILSIALAVAYNSKYAPVRSMGIGAAPPI